MSLRQQLEMVMFPWSALARIQGLQRRPDMGRSYPAMFPVDKTKSRDPIERGSRSGDWVDQVVGTQRKYTRLELYAIFREMDMDPLIMSVLDAFAEDATQRDFEMGRSVWATAKNSEVKKVVMKCLDRVGIEDICFAIVRSMLKYGDEFEKVVASRNAGVLRIRGYDAWDVSRIEDEDGRLEAFAPSDAEGRPTKFEENSVPFYKVLHFRLRGKDRNSIYGSSLLDGSREKWRQLQLIEDQIVMQRLLRRPDRLLILMDVGGMSLAEAYESCVAADTWITTEDGVHRADEVCARVFDGENILVRSVRGWETITKARIVEKETCRWRFERGLTLDASGDHRVAVWTPEKGIDWKRLENLREGEDVVVADEPDTDFAPDDDLAYLVALFAGDGHWQRRSKTDYAVFMLDAHEREEGYAEIARIVDEMDPDGWTRGWSQGRLCVKSPVLMAALAEAGFTPGGKTGNIPDHSEWLLSRGMNGALSYVQGLMDAEGHAGKDCVSNRMRDRLPLEYVHRALWRVGIHNTLEEYVAQGAPVFMLTISGKDADRYLEQVGFRLSCKMGKKTPANKDRHGTPESARFVQEMVEVGVPPAMLAEALEVPRGRIYQLKCGLKLLTWTRLAKGVKRLLLGAPLAGSAVSPEATVLCRKYGPMEGFATAKFRGSEALGVQTLIDYTVDGGESFVANNILTHNCKEWEDRIYKEHNVDPVAGLFTSQATPLHEARDLILPIGQDNNTRIENLPATTGNDLFRDFDIILGRLLGGLHIPKGYLGFEGQYEPNMTLGKQDVRFAKTAMRAQKAFLVELVRMCMIDMAFAGLDPFSEENAFNLHMTPVSAFMEIERAELMQMRMDAMDRLGRIGDDMQFNKDVWVEYILSEIARLPKDMIDKLRSKDEGAAVEAVEALKEDPKALAALTLGGEETAKASSLGVMESMIGKKGVGASKSLHESVKKMDQDKDKVWENLKTIDAGAKSMRAQHSEAAERRVNAIRGLSKYPVMAGV